MYEPLHTLSGSMFGQLFTIKKINLWSDPELVTPIANSYSHEKQNSLRCHHPLICGYLSFATRNILDFAKKSLKISKSFKKFERQ